ncbi:MAG TPA: hypothetical protein VNA68_02295 [Candidatus Dormibacteraeota bacterium]|nr:hypothetical protein [Candidatus Dormibacteraeota bacterium]
MFTVELGVPFNSVAWVVGAAGTLLLSYKSYKNWQKNQDPFSKYLAWFGLVTGIGLAFLGIPPILSSDETWLRIPYLIGQDLVFLGFLVQARIVWWLYLHNKMSFGVPALVTAIPLLYASSQAWMGSMVDRQPDFVTFVQPREVTVILGATLLVLFVATGLFFLWQVRRQASALAKIKASVIGMTYVIIGLSVGGHNLFYGYGTTPLSTVFNLGFFIALIISLLMPKVTQQEHQVQLKSGQPS